MNGQFWLALVDTADMVGFTLTFSVNIILLGLIRTRGKHLGTYKYLMSFFSFFSMFYAIVESILGPIMHIENATFFLISRKRFDYSTRLGKINSAFYCACFATSFVLSAVHFVYRYFAACKPHLLRYFNLPLLLLWPLGCSIPVTAWAGVSYFLYPDTEYTEAAVTYEENIQANRNHVFRKVLQTHYDGIKKENVSYIAYVYYQYEDGVRHVYIKNLLGCFVHYFVMSMTFVVVFYCGFSTWWTIREHRGASDRTRQLQNQLFNALVLQTLIPSIFMYIPTGVMFIAPFFDVNLNANANFIVFCSFLYPGLDPLILILIIREFRLTIFGIIKGKPGNNAVMDVHTNSRGKVSSVPVINLSG
ncbi:Protein CBR-STR-112 [Caenorhabditis briggsae]|uniref:Serpentine receptor class r-10 n=1 Tax=Caenorhabditis briggsae TaxID=6238 RepID=A8XUR7_CAEBR|nr:Protein CBR-STR-112 [Caenorhabditis briggsae]CAP36392.2 Protein CBR-STR-112 [Caenorhabditis briggsae]